MRPAKVRLKVNQVRFAVIRHGRVAEHASSKLFVGERGEKPHVYGGVVVRLSRIKHKGCLDEVIVYESPALISRSN